MQQVSQVWWFCAEKAHGLANPSTQMSLGWLLSKLAEAAKRKKLKKPKTANIKPTQVTEKQKKRPDGELEKTNNQAKAKSNPKEDGSGSCPLNLGGSKAKAKSTTGTSKHITYALGTECITHQDAYVSSI